jgi:hypothetical protein
MEGQKKYKESQVSTAFLHEEEETENNSSIFFLFFFIFFAVLFQEYPLPTSAPHCPQFCVEQQK